MLDESLGVPVPLQDDAFGLIVAEVDLVLQRPVSLARTISMA